MKWNLGDVFDFLGRHRPQDKIAMACGDRRLSWKELDCQSNNLARVLLDSGLEPGDKVAVYGRNSIEYLVALIATFKARLVYANVNFRYQSEELYYIFDYTDAAAIIYDSEFSGVVKELRPRLNKVRTFVEIDADNTIGEGVSSFTDLVEKGNGEPLDIERSCDDLMFICTGGTTGMPKAVMWRQHDTFQIAARRETVGKGAPEGWDELRESMNDLDEAVSLVCAPLMHGTGMYVALTGLLFGAKIIFPTDKKFDPRALLETVKQEQVTHLPLIGDAFGRPVVEELDNNPAASLKSVKFIISSAAPMSIDVKRKLLQHGGPELVVVDAIGSSESASFGVSRMTADGVESAPKITIGEHAKVFTEDLREVVPGSGETGFVVCGGAVPQGYYKAPKKSAEAFREIHGVRYSVPGDWCEVEADGTLKFLGRGNVCINSGGEKVYPQEVEAAVLSNDSVRDVIVVGVDDERWGQVVTAVVQMEPSTALEPEVLKKAVRQQLADYKVPKRFIPIDDIGRGPNGKADYRRIAEYARQYR